MKKIKVMIIKKKIAIYIMAKKKIIIKLYLIKLKAAIL